MNFSQRAGQVSRNRLLLVIVVSVVTFALLAAWLVLLRPASPPPGLRLTNLSGVGDLQQRFNADKGVARLIVIFSPT